MVMPIWLFTTPIIVPAGGLTVGLTLSATFGATPKTWSSAVVPYPILPAGKYAFFVFLAKVNTLLRQWILDCAAPAKLNITTVPALANVLLKFVLPATYVPTSDSNKLSVTFAGTGFAIGGNQMTIIEGNLDNTSGWVTHLGLRRESLTSFNVSASGNTLTWAGARQPSSLFVFERQGDDGGNAESVDITTRVLRDGTVRNHVNGATRADRIISLTDQEAGVLGGALPAATFASLDATRAILTLQTTDENGLTNASNLYQNEEQLVLGAYYRVGLSRHVARLDAKSGAPKTTSATFFEKAPVGSVPSFIAGQDLNRVGDYAAMVRRALDTGYVLVHEPDDTTGQSRFKGTPYALAGGAPAKPYASHSDGFLDLWSVDLGLVLRDAPELVL